MSRPARLPLPAATATALVAALSTTLAAIVFWRMTAPGVVSDIMLHARIAQQEIAAGRWFSYTLWTPALAMVSGNGRLLSWRMASVVLLSLATGAKCAATARVARTWGARSRDALVIGLGLVVAVPVLVPRWAARNGAADASLLRGAVYLGRLSPTVWHNSTSIASLPLIVVAAAAGRRVLERRRTVDSAVAGGLLALSALVKPNYALAALPVLGLGVLTGGPWSARLRRAVLVGVPTIGVLALQLVLVKSDPFVVPSEFTVEPWRVWRYYAGWPMVALTQSVVFPVLATVALVRRRAAPPWLWTCWATFAVAVAQLAVLGERNRDTGAPIYDGNWFWGAHATLLVLFVAAAAALSSASIGDRDRRASGLTVAAWVAFGLHVATGAVYIGRLFALPAGFAT